MSQQMIGPIVLYEVSSETELMALATGWDRRLILITGTVNRYLYDGTPGRLWKLNTIYADGINILGDGTVENPLTLAVTNANPFTPDEVLKLREIINTFNTTA